MPNHCSNKLGITGPIDDVEKFIAFVKNNGDDKDENEYNLFESLIPMPKELEGTTSPSKEGNVDLIDKYGHDNWYDWCNSKWGTKWGDYSMHATNIVYETKTNYPHLENGDKDYENGVSVLTGNANIHFEYDTAWAPGCNELANAIVNERRIELLGEGVRGTDITRLGLPLPAKPGVAEIKADAQQYIWPISSTELLLNPLCKDN